jgi:hypothetical protein
MNCTNFRERLAEYVYSELDKETRCLFDQHLGVCAECRQELIALQTVVRSLDRVPAATVPVDLPRLYRELALRQARRARRWKITAAAMASAAAITAICAIGTRLEVRREPGQLVFAWRGSAEVQVEQPAAPDARQEAPLSVEAKELATADRNRLLNDLIRAVADNMQTLEQREQHDAGDLQTRLVAIEQENTRRFAALERAVDALYLMSNKGAE